jgi:hypothetical protein
MEQSTGGEATYAIGEISKRLHRISVAADLPGGSIGLHTRLQVDDSRNAKLCRL